ncbi:glycerate kinase type-2 family protein [Desulfovibrio sp.]|uniref:glycerate kinase type-2 family protein n=1 Tax=Desulfovibrio sp. TaxID=885 RepID=UPI003FD6D25F
MELEARKAVLYSIFDAGVRAVAPDAALMRHVCLEGDSLLVDGKRWPLPHRGRLLVLGAGKGVAPMGAAVEELLGDRIHSGLLVVKYGHGLPLRQITQVEAAHPVPDAAGAAATQALLELAAGTTADDLVLCLLTGGASALTPAPVPGVTLEDMQQVTELLLRSGATIAELNAVRKHLSRFSGGQLARTAAPAGVVSVIVSDVVGDALDVIASGPTAPDASTFADCMDILARYELAPAMPPAVLDHLQKGCLRQDAETPKPGDALFRHVQNALVATNRQALDAADKMVEEAREQAALLVAQARRMAAELSADAQPLCLLAGGETTVTLRGGGRGGRNQEMALAASLALQDCPHVCALFAGTDGTDGPTDAAGGCAWAGNLAVTGMEQARHALEENDSYPILHHCGALLRTGPTRTNVMDLAVLLVWPEKAQ